MSENQLHTNGPWTVTGHGGTPDDNGFMVWANGAAVAHVFPRSETLLPVFARINNARRIVACVNACEGWDDPGNMRRIVDRDLPCLPGIAAERDALRAEVERLREALTHALHDAESRLYTMPLNAEPIERAIIEAQAKIYSVALGGQA